MSAAADRLRDEIAVLVASIDDARREHAAGDLDDHSLVLVVERDEARLAAARARLARIEEDPAERACGPVAARSGRSGGRRGLLAVAAACLVLATTAVVLAATDPFASAPRPPRITRPLTVSGLLFVAELAVEEGAPLRALSAYEAVLRLDPTNDEALVESAWLRYEEGHALHRPGWIRAGAAGLRHAVAVAPRDAAAHLYDGIALFQYDRDPAAARDQIERAGELPETKSEQGLTQTFLAILGPSR